MRFRVTKEEDLPPVMTILHQAQAYFKAHGIDQWQDGYPDEATLRRDIQNGTAYVAELDGAVAACATIAFAPDENYTTMVSGQWLTERPYAVIHRIAVDDKLKGQGIAGWILEQAEQMCRQRGVESLKIDTHQDNTSMRRLLEKHHYQYCGVIQLHRDLSLRVAYEKRLDEK